MLCHATAKTEHQTRAMMTPPPRRKLTRSPACRPLPLLPCVFVSLLLFRTHNLSTNPFVRFVFWWGCSNRTWILHVETLPILAFSNPLTPISSWRRLRARASQRSLCSSHAYDCHLHNSAAGGPLSSCTGLGRRAMGPCAVRHEVGQVCHFSFATLRLLLLIVSVQKNLHPRGSRRSGAWWRRTLENERIPLTSSAVTDGKSTSLPL
ncbi:hypothetical protein OF83DRAFT_1151340 [Amylostereum chailletii]|nr:hypothetical protein OF83DRAFT_1151340 [Amylostereum chailletii]